MIQKSCDPISFASHEWDLKILTPDPELQIVTWVLLKDPITMTSGRHPEPEARGRRQQPPRRAPQQALAALPGLSAFTRPKWLCRGKTAPPP